MKKNSCPEIDKLIANRLNLLADNERRSVENHLLDCPQCQKLMAIESEIDKELSLNFDPRNIEEMVLIRLRLIREFKPRQSWISPVLAILNSILIMVIVFFAGILLTEIWMKVVQYMTPAFLTGKSVTLISLMSIIFLSISILFGFRKIGLKYINF
ncbi:MAG: zf-HC2 domain-containing protein [bacterium]|nr:zf-HC2 domain-containing protein [bacterium]